MNKLIKYQIVCLIITLAIFALVLYSLPITEKPNYTATVAGIIIAAIATAISSSTTSNTITNIVFANTIIAAFIVIIVSLATIDVIDTLGDTLILLGSMLVLIGMCIFPVNKIAEKFKLSLLKTTTAVFGQIIVMNLGFYFIYLLRY